MKRNWEGLVLRAFGGRDFRLTVLEHTVVNDHYLRIRVDGGGLLRACDIHPTMWLRLWFDNDGKAHQRAYTLVDPDPATGQFSLEFAMHDGCAARWVRTARPGDVIEATLQGTGFTMPDPAPTHLYLVGDAASVPALNSLFDTAPQTPATVWLEYQHDGEKDLPLRARPHHAVTWVPRRDGGQHLVDTVCGALSTAAPDALYWACVEARSTRAIAKHLRKGLGLDKRRVVTLGYWNAS
ncbi:siderophore-interacting protein [Virgisporangium aliadipatigenens]|uniref:Siderophore-interacting protein n=1 Tax=Virgisporangium aliadipatigenens TaxID=741659 RepID=A0A8J3YN50_9ACTN|nr:siderophore-interacting protein [Virgisporangium aliadipatigenens]GIJ46748.1 siderophore-interacting protein [Virgisporangium aliadipatigenens]